MRGQPGHGGIRGATARIGASLLGWLRWFACLGWFGWLACLGAGVLACGAPEADGFEIRARGASSSPSQAREAEHTPGAARAARLDEPPAAPEPPRAARARAPRRSPELADAIAALPEIGRVEAGAPTPIVLRGALSRRRARAMNAVARAVVADVSRRFATAPAAPRHPVDVCLFEDDASYSAFVDVVVVDGGGSHSMLGFYLPRQRLVVANLGRSVGNLRHELVHPLIGDDFPSVPAWVNEGLGALYGTARLAGDRFEFLVNYRLRSVRAALARGSLPTLSDVAGSSREHVYGPDSGVYYGLARYLLLYLDARGTLDAFYGALRDGPVTAEAQRALLEAYVDYDAFVTWTRRLRVGRRPVVPR